MRKERRFTLSSKDLRRGRGYIAMMHPLFLFYTIVPFYFILSTAIRIFLITFALGVFPLRVHLSEFLRNTLFLIFETMGSLFNSGLYSDILLTMAGLAVVVFVALQFVTAPYGITFSNKWGPSFPNKPAWIMMEAPAFITMLLIWIDSSRNTDITPCIIGALFMLHYFQRSFIFPLLMKGKNRMPLIIVLTGATFNTINAYLLGGWIFHLAPDSLYNPAWLLSPQFIIGTVIFLFGMAVNLHSDYIIRHLRRPGDSRHYIPYGGMFRYVSSANYFGEFTEWVGFAILTWSLPGVVFALWTFANLAPRAKKVNLRYSREFGREFDRLHRKAIIPFLY